MCVHHKKHGDQTETDWKEYKSQLILFMKSLEELSDIADSDDVETFYDNYTLASEYEIFAEKRGILPSRKQKMDRHLLTKY